MRETGNTILITGGTSGIGRALAEGLHQRGNQVIITGRRQHLLDEIAHQQPGLRGFAMDVQDPQSVQRVAAQIRDEFPALNVLFNNAGIAQGEDFTQPPADLSLPRAIIETNIIGVLELTRVLLPHLLQQPSATIITTTSNLAFVPLAAYPTYSASKAFLHSWLQSLRFQLRQTAVEVLELAPPYVQTELGGAQQATDPHAMPLAEYAAEVLELLRQPDLPRGEIIVQRAQELRNAERNGTYEQAFQALNTMFA